ncbi:hypothetical protein PPTG_22743 [Phytophthora nicotianae INRA-310]|uniref:Uncharacterized protein n=1 Tax=Phytophthora nicotianae (strain INRA-310) TaxID=761204 RepID=W2QC59_PHYN3|nr:hypothetical protein PPTG_22743 [Phytophthora nicotianae INRA-310]ETN10446.1 hypothetical protein PPTG_22743 [Phytophthora nicotianae INRA-310]
MEGGALQQKTVKNWFPVAKTLHSFKIEIGTKFDFVDTLKELVLQMYSIERAFATKRKNFRIKRRFNGKCFYCKKSVHKVFEWRKKKAHDRCGHVAQAQASDIAFTTESAMTKLAWHVNSSASSHITSVWDKFVSMKD